MANPNTYYLNGPTLGASTAVYTDSNLSICAADGIYSDGVIAREQLNCQLLAPQQCPSCAPPCGLQAGESSNIQGSFLGQINVGTDLGAVVIYSIVGSSIPDGMLATYNGQTYNKLTFINNSNRPVGLNTPAGTPTYYGSSSNTPVSTGNIPIYSLQNDGSYLNTGNNQPITVQASQIDLRGGGGATVYTMVVPKNSAVATNMNVDIYAPILGTFFSWKALCPALLPSFTGSALQDIDTCSTADQTYYFAQNATSSGSGSGSVLTPQTLTQPAVGNLVFTDSYGASPINPTDVSRVVVLPNNDLLRISNGLVTAVSTCT